MNNVFNTIQNNYKASGSDGHHAEMFNDVEEIIESFRSVDWFEDQIDEKVSSLKFPIITFDYEDAQGKHVFDSGSTREDIMYEADNYFPPLNDGSSIWEFEEYDVFEETDLLRFENTEHEVIGYVQINLDEPYLTVIEELNRGADPIADGWEDGIGNTIGMNGWGEFDQSKEKIPTKKKDLEMGM